MSFKKCTRKKDSGGVIWRCVGLYGLSTGSANWHRSSVGRASERYAENLGSNPSECHIINLFRCVLSFSATLAKRWKVQFRLGLAIKLKNIDSNYGKQISKNTILNKLNHMWTSIEKTTVNKKKYVVQNVHTKERWRRSDLKMCMLIRIFSGSTNWHRSSVGRASTRYAEGPVLKS